MSNSRNVTFITFVRTLIHGRSLLTSLADRGMKLILVLLLASSAVIAQSPEVVSSTVDVSQRSELSNSVRLELKGVSDNGRTDRSKALISMMIGFTRTAELEAKLNQAIADQQDSSSPRFHQWLTPEQFGEQFGAHPQDIAKLVAWLRGAGFENIRVARGKTFITFDGSVYTAEQAFGTEIHNFTINNDNHFANSTNLTIPAAFAPLINGVSGLDNFYPQPAHQRLVVATPQYNYQNGVHYLAAEDIQIIYNMKPLYNSGYTGAGMKLVIAGEAPIAANDSSIAAYRSLNGLQAINLQTIPVDGTSTSTSNWPLEAYLDIEISGAIAKSASVIYVYEQNAFVAAAYALDNNLGQVLNMSLIQCEASAVSQYPSFESALKQAEMQGMTVNASSGDAGAASCESPTATVASHGLAVGYPASSAYVTAVGGTTFNEGSGTYWGVQDSNSGSAESYIPETAWNDTTPGVNLYGAGGGGVSGAYTKPSWQTGVGVPSDGHRDIPDISLAASANHDGYLVCTPTYCVNGFASASSTLPEILGGTSAAGPVFAGMMTVIDQKLGSGQGNINPKIYALAGTSYSTVFHDVTSGNNIIGCTVGTPNCTTGKMGYNAGVGYDLATGWGSVDGYAFANALSPTSQPTLTAFSATPSTVNGGATITYTTTLSAPAPTGGATISFNSSATNVVPNGSLTMPGGTTTGQTTVTAGTVALLSQAVITASYSGSTKQATVIVNPVANNPTISSIAISPTSITSGNSATVSVVLTAAAPSGGALITLGSNNSSAFPVISFNIAAGQTSGSASFGSGTVTSATTVTVTASYNGSTKQATITINPVGKTTPTVTVSPSQSSIPAGQSVNVTVTVAGNPTPTGSVILVAGTGSLSGALVNGVATITVPAAALSLGTNSLFATYQGDNNYNIASGSSSVTVTPAASNPTISSFTISPTSITSGSSATINVVLTSPAPTGGALITLSSNNSSAFPVIPFTIAAGQTSGSAGFGSGTVTSATTVTLTASYSGSTKQATVIVNPVASNPTIGSFTISPTNITSGSSATTNVVLTSPAPSGGALITLGSSNSSAFPVIPFTITAGQTSGSAGFGSGAVNTATTVTVTASYNGSSQQATVTVNPAAKTTPTVTVSPSLSSIPYGQSVNVTVTVAGSPTPTGSVILLAGIGSLSGALVNGVATIIVPAAALSLGPNSLFATYQGDTNYNIASGSSSVTVTPAAKTTPTVTVSPSQSSIPYGQSVNVTVTVAGSPTPTGSVILLAGIGSLSGALVNGVATITVPAAALSLGPNSLFATYQGDTNYNIASGSSSVTVVTAPPTTTTTTLGLSATTVAVGASVTFTASVTPTSPVPTGTVQFTVDGTNVGGNTSTLNGAGVATYTTSSLPVGFHIIGAIYSGSTTYAGSTAPPQTLTITNGPDFGITVSTPTLTAVNGSASNADTVTIASLNGFSGPVSLSCYGLPSGASCVFAPTNTISGNGATSLTISTLKASAIPGGPIATNRSRGWFASSGGTALAYLCLLVIRRRRTRWSVLGMLIVFAAVSFAIGCGGASSSNGTPTLPSKSNTTLTLTPTTTAPAKNTVDTIVAAVSPSTATGTVQFTMDGVSTGSAVTVGSGRATYPVTFTTAGSHTVGASYTGDSNFNSSSASPLTLNVPYTNGTIPGVYSVLVTATSGSLIHSASVSLTVQ